MNVGRLIEARKARGLTQKRLASFINITPVHLSNVEKNKRGLTVANLIKVCDVLDISIDWLTGRSPHREVRRQLDD